MSQTITATFEDGVLKPLQPLNLPPNSHVRVTVEPMHEAKPSMDRAAWLRFIQETGGSIPDPTFERPPQGEYEQREPLP